MFIKSLSGFPHFWLLGSDARFRVAFSTRRKVNFGATVISGTKNNDTKGEIWVTERPRSCKNQNSLSSPANRRRLNTDFKSKYLHVQLHPKRNRLTRFYER